MLWQNYCVTAWLWLQWWDLVCLIWHVTCMLLYWSIWNISSRLPMAFLMLTTGWFEITYCMAQNKGVVHLPWCGSQLWFAYLSLSQSLLLLQCCSLIHGVTLSRNTMLILLLMTLHLDVIMMLIWRQRCHFLNWLQRAKSVHRLGISTVPAVLWNCRSVFGILFTGNGLAAACRGLQPWVVLGSLPSPAALFQIIQGFPDMRSGWQIAENSIVRKMGILSHDVKGFLTDVRENLNACREQYCEEDGCTESWFQRFSYQCHSEARLTRGIGHHNPVGLEPPYVVHGWWEENMSSSSLLGVWEPSWTKVSLYYTRCNNAIKCVLHMGGPGGDGGSWWSSVAPSLVDKDATPWATWWQ